MPYYWTEILALLNAPVENQNHKRGSKREQALQFPMLLEDFQPHDGFIIFIFLQWCVKLTTPKLNWVVVMQRTTHLDVGFFK